ncbi:MAG: hypothetical protein QW265_04735 [Candidatus Bathyarchaeia archaeon]
MVLRYVIRNPDSTVMDVCKGTGLSYKDVDEALSLFYRKGILDCEWKMEKTKKLLGGNTIISTKRFKFSNRHEPNPDALIKLCIGLLCCMTEVGRDFSLGLFILGFL